MIRLEKRLGECASPSDIVNELYKTGSLDDTQAGRYVAADEFMKRFGARSVTPHKLMCEIADDLGTSRSTLYRAVQKMNNEGNI